MLTIDDWRRVTEKYALVFQLGGPCDESYSCLSPELMKSCLEKSVFTETELREWIVQGVEKHGYGHHNVIRHNPADYFGKVCKHPERYPEVIYRLQYVAYVIRNGLLSLENTLVLEKVMGDYGITIDWFVETFYRDVVEETLQRMTTVAPQETVRSHHGGYCEGC